MSGEKQNHESPTGSPARGKFLIRNRLGLHARAAAVLVQLANRFSADIKISKDDIEASGKSIMSVLQLAAVQGEQIEVVSRGPDCDEAVQAIGELVEQLFGEEE